METDTVQQNHDALARTAERLKALANLPMNNLSEKALALCYAIEAAGASEALTKCSVLAAELHDVIKAENARIKALAEKMNKFVAENYPLADNGKKDFCRVLVEGYSEELLDP